MHRKLIRTFIDKDDDVEDNQVRNKYGVFTAIVGILSNIILFVVKITVGIFLGSISILADALNNLVDSISSIITLVGFKLAALPADKEHPFGHARYESISGLLVGIIVIFVGIEFAQASFKEIMNPTSVTITPFVLVLLVITVLIKLWQFSFNKFVGKKIDSKVILATSVDSRNDMLITILVLIGVIAEYLFNVQVDGYVGMILAIVILLSGFNAMRETVAELLGQRPSNEDVKAMEELLLTYDNILGYHDLVVHQYGHNQYFATLHVEVDADKTLIDTHRIIDKIENEFLNKLKINLVIHQDPVILNDPVINAYLKTIKEIVKEYDSEYSLHDFRLIDHNSYNIIIFDLVVIQDEIRTDEIITNELITKINQIYKKDKIKIIIDRNYLEVRGN